MRRIGAAAVGASAVSLRPLSTRGQYNPIHNFDVTNDAAVARNFDEFRAMTTNPGPLRVAYSVDYLDWYFRAYSEKVRRHSEKVKRAAKLPQGGVDGGDAGALVPRLKSSAARTEGERLREHHQRSIDRCAVQHGVYDLYERHAQFPAIHIDRCDDHHVRELVRYVFFDAAMSSTELWELALIYRAMLVERRASYPESFSYIFDAVEATRFEQPDAEDDSRRAPTSPTSADQAYYAHLVSKYHVENAAEAHVLLQCHAHADAAQLLLSIPPPKEDAADAPVSKRPSALPPLEALLLPENMNLARCLLFAELNTTADMDPFAKFPNAAAHMTRPTGDVLGAARSSGMGLAMAITERRGKLFAPLSQAQQAAADARGRDIQRLQAASASRAANAAREIDRAAEEMPHAFQSDHAVFNPRAVRAELRDATSRRLLRHLRKYDEARAMTLREPLLQLESTRRSRVVSHEVAIAATRPTVAHFSALLLGDRHVSFALTTAAQEALSARIEAAVADAARLFFKLSVEYHDATIRKVNVQKLQIALALLDEAVAAALESTTLRAEVARLGPQARWAGRQLDELGYPTTARFDDYRRWIAAGSVKLASST